MTPVTAGGGWTLRHSRFSAPARAQHRWLSGVGCRLSAVVTTLSAPSVSQLTYDQVAAPLTEMLGVPDRHAVRRCLDLAEHVKVWAESAVGCLLPAARRAGADTGSRAERFGLR